MKSISLSVSEDDYEAFREAASRQGCSIAHLIREAMANYRESQLERRRPLRQIATLPGHRLVGELPGRSEVYDEIFARERPE